MKVAKGNDAVEESCNRPTCAIGKKVARSLSGTFSCVSREPSSTKRNHPRSDTMHHEWSGPRADLSGLLLITQPFLTLMSHLSLSCNNVLSTKTHDSAYLPSIMALE